MKIPVLEMLTSSTLASGTSARAGPEGYVLWPCRAEELKKQIDTFLLLDERHDR